MRPALLRWVWYAFGGKLPDRNRRWVLHDNTAETWELRHVARALVRLSVPILLLVLLAPGSLGYRVVSALVALAAALLVGIKYRHAMAEGRVVQAGYPRGTGVALRDQLALRRQQRRRERRR